MPIYEVPTDPAIKWTDIPLLKIVGATMLHIRIAHDHDDKIADMPSLYPEMTRNLYIIP